MNQKYMYVNHQYTIYNNTHKQNTLEGLLILGRRPAGGQLKAINQSTYKQVADRMWIEDGNAP